MAKSRIAKFSKFGSSREQWTPAEDAMLRAYYPLHGVGMKNIAAAKSVVMFRSPNAIRARAFQLGVKNHARQLAG